MLPHDLKPFFLSTWVSFYPLFKKSKLNLGKAYIFSFVEKGIALQMGSLCNSWSQAFYGHMSLQITLVAKIQMCSQVFRHIPDPRIKILLCEVDANVYPNKSFQKWAGKLTILHLFTSVPPLCLKPGQRDSVTCYFRVSTQPNLDLSQIDQHPG